MYPRTIQFETRQMEHEAELRLYGEDEATAQAALVASRSAGGKWERGWFRRRFLPTEAPHVPRNAAGFDRVRR